mgnify:CR=1 FL=1
MNQIEMFAKLNKKLKIQAINGRPTLIVDKKGFAYDIDTGHSISCRKCFKPAYAKNGRAFCENKLCEWNNYDVRD